MSEKIEDDRRFVCRVANYEEHPDIVPHASIVAEAAVRVFEAQDADSAALRAELERVRGLVREAFTEGYEHAEYHNEKNIQHSGRMEDAWKYSDSAAALVITQTPTEEGGGDAQ